MVTKPLEDHWKLEDYGFLEEKFVHASYVQQSAEDGETETHERADTGNDSENNQQIDSGPEEWDLPENSEYTEFQAKPIPRPLIREDRV